MTLETPSATPCCSGNLTLSGIDPDRKQHWVMTVKLFLALSAMVRMGILCVLGGIVVGVFLGVQLAALAG